MRALGRRRHRRAALAPPVAVLERSDSGCLRSRPINEATDALELDTSRGITDHAVVELFFREECTGLGGEHVIGRDVDQPKRHFSLGGHGCRGGAPPAAFGVVSYGHTAALGQSAACVELPGELGFTYDTQSRAVATFDTLESARAFADAL